MHNYYDIIICSGANCFTLNRQSNEAILLYNICDRDGIQKWTSLYVIQRSRSLSNGLKKAKPCTVGSVCVCVPLLYHCVVELRVVVLPKKNVFFPFLNLQTLTTHRELPRHFMREMRRTLVIKNFLDGSTGIVMSMVQL